MLFIGTPLYAYGYAYKYGTTLVSSLTVSTNAASTSDVYTYTYNNLGYITNVKKNGTTIASYSYDSLGQLISESNAATGEIYIYTYDKAGNITKKDIYVGDIGNLTDTITYTYGNTAWKDRLTNYDGTAITYDSMGNPTKWVGIAALTWNGRQLTYLSEDGLDHGVAFTYNADGIRTKKVFYDYDGSVTTHNYVLDGTTIVKETVTSGTATTTLEYYYDDSGVSSFRYNGTLYYYVKNLQGDVIGIMDNSGVIVVEYTYDAWGKILSVTGSMASTLGQVNPFRYRGYYYDSETGLYYLNSRYYDAEVGRFISADGIVGANGGLQGYNMFAYCNNNPAAFADPTGNARLFSYKKDAEGIGSGGGSLSNIVTGVCAAAILVAGTKIIDSITTAISDLIETINDKITEKKNSSEKSKEQNKAKEKIKEEAKKLKNGQCLIVAWGSDNIPFVYGGVVSIDFAIKTTLSDMVAGSLSLFPSDYRNIAIVTPLETDAARFIAGIGSVPYDDVKWANHSPLPHYHTTPHILTIGDKQYDIHAFYLY